MGFRRELTNNTRNLGICIMHEWTYLTKRPKIYFTLKWTYADLKKSSASFHENMLILFLMPQKC